MLSTTSSFKLDDYIIHNNQGRERKETHSSMTSQHESGTRHHIAVDESPRTRCRAASTPTASLPPPPSPPHEQETSDYFEEWPAVAAVSDSDDSASELDELTMRKMVEMQAEIMRCHVPALNAPTDQRDARPQPPVKLRLTDQDFHESYSRQHCGAHQLSLRQRLVRFCFKRPVMIEVYYS